jgi:beta-lactamase class A
MSRTEQATQLLKKFLRGKRHAPVLGLVLGSFALLSVGYLVGKSEKSVADNFDGFVEMRLGSLNGELTNPVLECKEGRVIASEKEDFRRELETFVNRLERETGLSRIGVSFRDLNNGPSFGIDRDVAFLPASLFKVPVMIAFLKHAETEPEILETKIVFREKLAGVTQIYPPEIALVVGETYSIKELIERMIKYSDNDAFLLLLPHVPEAEEHKLYGLLGMDLDSIRTIGGAMSVREYSSFFRILFNSSFLTRAYSEYALGLLTSSTFDAGLRRGVPDDIQIARKFGERKLDAGTQHFHDCGIVYYPKHPYLLCVMTQGSDVSEQIEAIASVSSFVYTKIAEQYPR